MIASLHLADVGTFRAMRALRRTSQLNRTPGLVYGDLLVVARLSGALFHRPYPRKLALFGVWDDDAALDRFLTDDRLAEVLAPGRSLRLQPLRASGSWPGLSGLADIEQTVADDEPVAVLTCGRLKLNRALAFLQTTRHAEADAVADPQLLANAALGRPPYRVSTFTLWRSADAMREYAYSGIGHMNALRAGAERDFFRESIFLRFRPYAATGDWGEGPESLRDERPGSTPSAVVN
jgi:hypothetical protein